jgi:hypothetical protein
MEEQSMKRVERTELLGLAEYEQIRAQFQKRIIADKRDRRFTACDEISIIFENHDTVLYQVQEMLRTERITKEAAISHELETYNDLIPGDQELSGTMFVEIADAAVRDRRLVELAGLESCIGLVIDGETIHARNETRGVLPDRTTAVHYIKFPLGEKFADRVRKLARVMLVIDHPKLQVRTEIPPSMVRSLAADLEG